MTCFLCGESTADSWVVEVGKHGTRVHESCAKRAEMQLHIARERARAKREIERTER